MERETCGRYFALVRVAGALGVALSLCPSGQAQAWVPLRGQGAVTTSFQRIDHSGHRLSDGFLIPAGRAVNLSGYIEMDYGLTDRISFSAGVPYVFGKYTDVEGPPPPLPFLPQDACGCWRSGWQDVGVTARYNAYRSESGTISVTPSISVGVPSHSYDHRGENALGRNLTEVTLALDVGGRLDAISPNLMVGGRYSYGFVEQVVPIPNDRSKIAADVGYAFLRGRLLARSMAFWQRTHGGLRVGNPATFPGEVNTPERIFEHDRLLRDNYFHAGGALSYSLPQVDVFGSFVWHVNGTDTHAGSTLTMGVSWPFEWRPTR